MLAQEHLELTYTGNMGVLIHDQKTAILIDGLHKEYQAAYLFPPPALTNQLINGQKGIPAISLLLNTHFHRDHFDEALSAQFLQKNPTASFIGSQQAVDLIGEASDQIQQRLIAIPYEDYQKRQFAFTGFSVKAFKMDHVNPTRHHAVQNLGFIINIDGLKILHIGDSHWYEDIQLFEKVKMMDENIDVAILPYWMLLSGKDKEQLNQYIHPEYLIATHIPPDLSEADAKAIWRIFPNAILFQTLGQTLHVEGS